MEESDWGFTRFAEIRKLFAPQWEDKGRPMVENDAVNVTAYVRIYKDPTGVLWHNFIKSVFEPHHLAKLAKKMKLQFEKGNRNGWP